MKTLEVTLIWTKMGRRIRKAMAAAGVDPDLAKDNLRYLLDLLWDFLYIRYHPNPWGVLEDRVVIQGLEVLKERVSCGRGEILLALHKGNFPWVFAKMAGEVPLNVVLKRFREPWVERELQEALYLAKIKGIRPEGATFKVKEALRKGEVVVYLVDQYFLGMSRGDRTMGLQQSLELFAQRFSAIPLPLALSHQGEKVIARILQPLDPFKGEGLLDWIWGEIYKEPPLWLWWYRLGKAMEEGRWPSILKGRASITPKKP